MALGEKGRGREETKTPQPSRKMRVPKTSGGGSMEDSRPVSAAHLRLHRVRTVSKSGGSHEEQEASTQLADASGAVGARLEHGMRSK